MSSTPSKSQYDDIGSRYAAIKNQQSSSFELAAIQKHIGDITDLRILDLACGAGYYTQKLLEWGAERVVGIDISQAMIESARAHCGEGDANANVKNEHHQKFHFHVADCSKRLENLGEEKFDLVLAVWFLNYASDRSELVGMWRNIFARLEPGARCVGIVPNFESLRSGEVSESRHGVKRNIVRRVHGGAKVRIVVCGREESGDEVAFEAYVWERELYEECAREAGMGELKWLEFVDPLVEGLDFEGFLEGPHFKCFVALRPGE